MAQDPQNPDHERLPAAAPGAAAGGTLQMRGNLGLGMPMQQAQGMEDDDDVIDLRDLWRMVVKHKKLLVAMAIGGLLVALLLSFIKTPLYLATTTIQVDQRAPRVLKFDQDADTTQGVDDRTGMGTQLELLKSRALAERVIDELHLDRSDRPLPTAAAPASDVMPAGVDGEPGGNDAGEATGWWAILGGLGSRIQSSYRKLREPSSDSAERLSRAQVVSAFRGAMKVEQVRNSRMLKVHVENTDPQLAARIANTLADGFIALNLERRMDSSSYAKDFLETQLGLSKAKLEESERKLQQYAHEHNILMLDEKTNVLNQTFTEYSSALTEAEQNVIKTAADYQTIRSAPNTARQVLENQTIQNYKAQISKLDQDYQEASKIFKENYPTIQQLRGQIDELNGRINAEIQGILVSVGNEAKVAKQQADLIRKRLEETRAQIVAAQNNSVELNLLKREVDTNRELYDGLLQQFKEVGVAGGVEANNIQVVDRAEAPLFPFKPRLGLNAAIGLLAGCMLGLGLVFVTESMDDSIKFADEVEQFLQLPLLGVIPMVKDKGRASSLALLVHQDPRGQLAEAYRSLRTALQFSTTEGAPSRLVVTSTTKNEGKSTTAVALAINFAQMGAKVVLIDADMRNPVVHKYLSLSNTMGLSNYLSGHGELDDVVQKSVIDNLWVITGGQIPPSPVDLLTGRRLCQLMDLLQVRGVQYIIFDGPPVLGLADAIVLGNQVQSVLFAAQASQTRKSHIKDALRRLSMAGVMPCGVVLTKTTAQNMAYYSYDGYYGYGVDTSDSDASGGEHMEPALTTT